MIPPEVCCATRSSTVALKAAGAAIPLWFVHPWGATLPRAWRIRTATVVAGGLCLYGAVEIVAESLVELGVVRPGGSADWLALRWQLGLWDSWFLLWGLLLGGATWQFAQGRSGSSSDGGALGSPVDRRHQPDN